MTSIDRSAKVSQRDIAAASGVSQATVSLVLSGRSERSGIPPATRRRVEDAAHELAYTPNVAAQSLRGGRTGLIGVHTYERIFPVRPDAYYNQFLVGMEEEAASRGLDLVLFASAQKPSGERTVYKDGTNRMRLSDGAVILGSRKDDSELGRLVAEGFPIVAIGRPDDEAVQVPFVGADYAGALAEVVDLLAGNGHRRVLYVGYRERLTARRDRLDGFAVSTREAGFVSLAPALLDPDRIDGAWLSDVLASGVTAITAETVAHSRAISAAAASLGVSVPGGLSLVCLDVGSDPSGFTPWSHIVVPRYELGRRAVAVLVDLLGEGPGLQRSEILPCAGPDASTVGRPSRR